MLAVTESIAVLKCQGGGFRTNRIARPGVIRAIRAVRRHRSRTRVSRPSPPSPLSPERLCVHERAAGGHGAANEPPRAAQCRRRCRPPRHHHPHCRRPRAVSGAADVAAPVAPAAPTPQPPQPPLLPSMSLPLSAGCLLSCCARRLVPPDSGAGARPPRRAWRPRSVRRTT